MSRLSHIDGLRGAASLAVCWYHMTHGGKLLGDGAVAKASSFGFLGVEVFFVISGFVIPWSMERSGYRWRDFGSFFAKRLLRVHPPFVVACLVAVLLNIISTQIPGYAGSLTNDYPLEALRALGFDSLYLSGILGRDWILVVAWTLAIEVQFYLLAGILFPLLSMKKPWSLGLGLLVLAIVAFGLSDGRWIFAWLPFFTLGWAAAWLKQRSHWAGWLAAGVSLVMAMVTASFAAVLAALGAFLFILFWKRPLWRVWGFLGAISYSLYLVHVPVGGRVVNLAGRFVDGPWAMGGVALFGTLISIAFGWAFWRWIEKPVHQWSLKWRAARASPAVESVSSS